MKEYETEKIKIDDIKLDGDNPNKLDPEMDKRLGQSMKEFGNTQDIVVDKNTMILADGEHRLQQYIKEGIKEIPVKLIPFKNDAHRRAYRQAANKIKGEHRDDLDAQEYMKIIEAGEKDLLRMVTGLSIGDVEKHLRRQNLLSKEEDFDAEEEYKKITEPITKTGDIWKLGEHRVMCGDATNSEDVGLIMGDKKAQLCFTSPPYNLAGDLYENYKDDLKSKEFIKFNLIVAKNIKIFLDGFVFWNMSYNKNARYEFIEIFYKLINEVGFEFLENIIWDKTTALPNNSKKMLTRTYEDILVLADKEFDIKYYFLGTNKKKYMLFKKTSQMLSNYWKIPVNNVQLENIQACYPVELPMKGILLTTKEKEIVLDPFGGSGTTLIACEKLMRKCRMMEIDPIYCDVIKMRWETFTGLKAEKIL